MEPIRQLLSPDFMPHGYCYLWDPGIVWLHVLSDALITLSYYCIPVVLVYFIRKNRDIPFNRIFWMFGTFILACGTTHLMEIWNIWHASYLAAGVVKALTAAVSVLTVAMLVPLVPKIVSLPARMHLQEANRRLEKEIAERKRFDGPIEGPMRRRVTAGFVVALFLTVFISVSSWRGTLRAEQDAYWVSHTHEVLEAIQRSSRHVIEAETSARAFALSGQDPLLAHYQTAREAIYRDEDALRRLTADNPGQQRRLDVLDPQVRIAIAFAETIIAKRRKTQAYPGGAEALETEKLMDVVRGTTHQMYTEETQLLAQRAPRVQAGQRRARVVSVVGAVLLAALWGLAWVAVNREIDISAKARAQVNTLNAELEQRVRQRTAALESEIAERKRAEERNSRLAAIVDSSEDAIISKTLEGTITAWNHGAEKLFGYSSSEAVGKSMRMILPPERANEEPDILARIARGESVDHFETVRIRKDGTRISVSASISPIRDRSGTIVGASKIARDITERKRAAEVLHEQGRMLDSAQVFVRDLESRVVFWPQGAQKLYGFTPQEAVGVLSHDLFQTRFFEPLEEIEKKFFETGTWEGELIHVRRDGSVMTVASAWILHRDQEGRPVRILETNNDITARKQAEETLLAQAEELSHQADELARSREALEAQTLMLQSVLNSMAEGLVVADEQGKFVIWNPAAEKILGLGAANLPSQQWTAHYGLYLADTVTPFPADQLPLVRALAGESSTAEIYVHNPQLDEGGWIEASGGPLKDKDGVLRGGVVAFRDITRRKADEREIRELNGGLEQRVIERTVQLEAARSEMEAFTYSVSHDLRAPLRHIAGFVGILMEDCASQLDTEAKHHLARIQEGTRRMGVLVDELLALARIGRQSLTYQHTNLNSLVDDVVTMLKPETEGRQIQWNIANLPRIDCDPTLMRQVFQNLISNALKYSRNRTPAVIEIGHREENGQSTIFVRDNGAGFSMKYADKLFGVFQRLHRAEEFEGTGVGLATVQRIVQKHGGRAWAEAEVDKGATFYFTFGAAVMKTIAQGAGWQK